MLPALVFSALLVLGTVLIHYETLRVLSLWLPRLTIAPRPRLIVVVLGMFVAHAVEVLLHAAAYFVLADHFGVGHLGGVYSKVFLDYLYFSTATYTSLGFGDVAPHGALRLMAGIEALIGLMMITWSASFAYLAMEKFWGLHGVRRAPRA